ncbi:MgtC/SapB family protein [Pontibacillus sp. ALD_SL1]|uniref:MgtC/SapB family protein n=1 Tax=Pontibacillus sp. ALD_SL1 TaxID=2777185 RepID=UPI0035305306
MSMETFFNDYLLLMTVRLVTAVVLCGLIGFEREIKNHSAGFRTHILVGVGACVMMLLSLYGFDPYLNKHDGIRFDPARIPSYVISGIGFLGAGTIMVHGVTIRGLTTAASIWVVAGLGLVIGAGMYGPAILTTVVVLLSLIVLNNTERIFKRKSKHHIQIVVFEGLEMSKLMEAFEHFELDINHVQIENEMNGQRNILIELAHNAHFKEIELFDRLSTVPHVKCVYQRK